MLDEFNTKGFYVVPNLLCSELILELIDHENIIKAHHGFNYENKYITNIRDKSNYIQYCTEEASDILYNKVNSCISKYVNKFLPNSQSYNNGSFICQKNGWNMIAPHLDTPNRFLKFNKTKELLGLHAFIPLDNFNKESGGTAFLPGSHNYFFDHWGSIQGKYQELFLDNCEQVTCSAGDVLFFNTRCLHSSMPNTSGYIRRAYSINYIRNDILLELKKLVSDEDTILSQKMQTGENMITRDVE